MGMASVAFAVSTVNPSAAEETLSASLPVAPLKETSLPPLLLSVRVTLPLLSTSTLMRSPALWVVPLMTRSCSPSFSSMAFWNSSVFRLRSGLAKEVSSSPKSMVISWLP